MDSKKICIGILAHVDAGKTTLSEALLYIAGSIRNPGRVDNRDSFLDTYFQERERGITIFSKQTLMEYKGIQLTLIDTPGHVDFSAEMERTLEILDYAILVISGADGVQSHTQTLWRLLEKYNVPVFIFVNKMDQAGCDKKLLMENLQKKLSDSCVDFSCRNDCQFIDNISVSCEEAMDEYISSGSVTPATISDLIFSRKIFPCFFGSALKMDGIDKFMDAIAEYADAPRFSVHFGAKIYKISRDENGNRLTHMKITGGILKVKDAISRRTTESGERIEKVNQIRIYSGTRYDAVNEVGAGTICAVTGLSQTKPGQGIGFEEDSSAPLLKPVLTYDVLFPDTIQSTAAMQMLKEIEEEIPEIHVTWNYKLQKIQVQLMGEVQTEILKGIISQRFGINAEFGKGTILYNETIASTVEGVGHYEPLKHYAEVHLIMQPLPRGTGLVFDSTCSVDSLSRSWQNLILTHLKEKEHMGVLTGSPITDIRITLASGKDHLKHTEGGDFRQATYRAVRQGLMHAQNVLLEPYYNFRLEIPAAVTGRAISDIQNMSGSFEIQSQDRETTVITGSAPVATMQHYSQDVTAYTHGKGRLYCEFKEYAPCHNAKEVINNAKYDPEADIENTPDSVFCAHGAGYNVNWRDVKNHMHLESTLEC